MDTRNWVIDDLDLVDGVNAVTVTITDYAGNTSTKVITLTQIGKTEREDILSAINAAMVSFADPTLSFDVEYTYAYSGAVSGKSTQDGYVCVFSMTDTFYLQDIQPVAAGAWSSLQALAGIKIIENTASAILAADGTVSGHLYAITGVGTHFAQQAVVGGTIYVDNQRRFIRSIESDTDLTLWATVKADFSNVAYSLIGLVRARTISQGTLPVLPRSFPLPYTDVDYEQTGLGTRCYTYDAGLFLHVCAQTFNTVYGNRVVDALATTSGLVDAHLGTTGAIPFSDSAYNLGTGDQDTVRSGASAWVGMGLLAYCKVTGYAPALMLAEKIATYLSSLTVTMADPTHLQAGLIKGGQVGAVLTTWISLEHNVDSYFFFKQLYNVTLNTAYRTAYENIAWGLLTHIWIPSLNRFAQGAKNATDLDYGEALDLYSWGGMFLLDRGELSKAAVVADRMFAKFYVQDKNIVHEDAYPDQYQQEFANATKVDGLRTYATTTDGDVSYSYVNPPDSIWQEGMQGGMLFLERLGGFLNEHATLDIAEGVIYQTTNDGSVLMFTSSWRTLPYEFQVWRALAPECWWYMRLVNQDLMLPSADIFYASNTTPIVITTILPHGLVTGQLINLSRVMMLGSLGLNYNHAANGNWQVTVLTATTFSLDGSKGNGIYVGGGTITKSSPIYR